MNRGELNPMKKTKPWARVGYALAGISLAMMLCLCAATTLLVRGRQIVQADRYIPNNADFSSPTLTDQGSDPSNTTPMAQSGDPSNSPVQPAPGLLAGGATYEHMTFSNDFTPSLIDPIIQPTYVEDLLVFSGNTVKLVRVSGSSNDTRRQGTWTQAGQAVSITWSDNAAEPAALSADGQSLTFRGDTYQRASQ